MERKLWKLLYQLARQREQFHFSRLDRYEDSLIVAVHFWSVIHDRPTDWSCDPGNWPKKLRKLLRRLPSQPTMSRRMNTVEVQRVLAAMEGQLVQLAGREWVWIIDGKPLSIGSHSKDPDAKWGRAGSGMAKGYKLHAIYGSPALPTTWEIRPMNINEQEVALHLLGRHRRSGCLLGDKEYDSNRIHAMAWAVGVQLLAPRQRSGAALGHHRHAPGRLRCLEILATPSKALVKCIRNQIERNFGWLTNHAAGLAPLPAWVRRIHRVRTWVQSKLIAHAVYVYQKQGRDILACE
jgi:hypothetical protein